MKSFFIDMEGVCIKLGIDLKEEGYRLVGFCPFHSETRPSFNIYRDTNSFYCFSCQQGGNPYKLVSLLVDEIRSWRELIRWYTTDGVVRRTPVRATPSLARIRKLLGAIEEVVLPEAEESQDPFLASLGILFAPEGYLAGRHIIPVTIRGRLVAYEARDFTGRLTPKTLALPPDVKIHSYLWNLDNVVIGFPIVVVEGIKGAIAVLNFGYVNVVSSFGARLTSDQVMLLMSKSPTEVVIAYDADDAGRAGTDNAVLSMLAWTQVSKVGLPEGTDPWDVSKTVWDQCLEARERTFVSSENKKLLRSLKQAFFA